MSFELIETVTVGAGGASSIEFTSIPQDGTDLLLKLSLRDTDAGINKTLRFRFNNSFGATDYGELQLLGANGSVISSFDAEDSDMRLGTYPRASTTANTFGNTAIYISNYTGTSLAISADSATESNDAFPQLTLTAGRVGVGPVTSIQILSLNAAQHSTAYLYKITAS